MVSVRLDSQTQLNSVFDTHEIITNEWSRSKALRVDGACSRREHFTIRPALDQGFACAPDEFHEPKNGKIRSAVLNLASE